MKQIIINSERLQTRVAVVENGKLQDFLIERKDRDRLVGSIFKGRIRNLEPSLQAAFVDIGTTKNAFLHYWDMLPATVEMLEGDSQESKYSEEEQEFEGKKQKSSPPPRTFLERIKQSFKVPKQKISEKTKRHVRPKRKRSQYTVEDIPDLFKENSEVIVQVTKGPIGTKGARVTTNLSIPGRYLVLLPNASHIGVSKRVEDREERERLRQILRRLKLPQGMGIICRTVGAGRQEKHFQRDLAMLLKYWRETEEKIRKKNAPCCIYEEPSLVERALRDYVTEDIDEVIADSREAFEVAQEIVHNFSKQERVKLRYYKHPRPVFAKYNLSVQIENIFRRQVPLPGGGYLCIDETEALIAIDVNSGKNKAGKDHPETIINTNLEAVDEVARQLRLRNIGGLVVVDLIDMRSKRDQQTVYRTFKDALLKDRAKTKTCPISSLGLLEMTRQRERESIQSTVYSTCPYCEGKGLVKSAVSMSVEIQRRLREILQRRHKAVQVRVTVHPQILERLKNEDADLIVAMEKEYGGELSFRGDPSLHMEDFRLNNLTTGEEL